MKEPNSVDATRSLLKTLVLEHPLDTIWRNANRYLVIKDDSLIGKVKSAGEGGLRQRLAKLGGVGQAANDEASKRLRRDDEPLGPDSVESEFASFLAFGIKKPSGLDSYSGMLAELQAALGESGTPDTKAVSAVLRTQRAKLGTLISSYNENGWEAAMLERILMPPLRGSEGAVVGATGELANRKWCESIVVVYDQLLAEHYPFATGKAVRDARLADVEKFFMPKTGTLWQYFNDSLANDIDHPAGTTLYRLKEGAGVAYKPALFAFLKKAEEITQLLFRDPTKLSVPYAIRIHPTEGYSKIQYVSGGRTVTYINTKERWEDVMWPARGAGFTLYDQHGHADNGNQNVDWGLFHLLDDAKIERASDTEDFLKATWPTPLGDGQLRADFKPTTLWKPFRGFDMPRVIVNGARGCGAR
jgi:type VI protein secretion system component VasK